MENTRAIKLGGLSSEMDDNSIVFFLALQFCDSNCKVLKKHTEQ